ncbi:MAG TPA: hypothetical protein VK638_40810 [Edaphobacter sp.]|nr:hypothetical protein [Edaphobacter sp.]
MTTKTLVMVSSTIEAATGQRHRYKPGGRGGAARSGAGVLAKRG